MHTESILSQASEELSIGTVRAEIVEGDGGDVGRKASGERITVGSATDNELVLKDSTVSGYHMDLVATGRGIRIIDHDSTNGTVAQGIRIGNGIVPGGTVLRVGRTKLRVELGDPMTVALHKGTSLGNIRGQSPAMRRLMARIERAAQSETAVLLTGESGTGKELIARAIHELSPRNGQPLVTVDCASMSPQLIASQIFGHEKGAFTDAHSQRIGAFENADGGTIFLDEIGELPPDLQTHLLGVLERRRFCRVGGHEEIEVNVRVVCATNRDLRSEVNNGKFRLDLYYRIAVVVLAVPALRERPEDVPLLIEHFLREAGHAESIDDLIEPAQMKELQGYRWPGNARELRNWVEATIAMGESPALEDELQPSATDDFIGNILGLQYKTARSQIIQTFEKRYLSALMQRCEDNVSKAAREAQMDRSHLNDLLRRHGLR